jgi:hypothetical protein
MNKTKSSYKGCFLFLMLSFAKATSFYKLYKLMCVDHFNYYTLVVFDFANN